MTVRFLEWVYSIVDIVASWISSIGEIFSTPISEFLLRFGVTVPLPPGVLEPTVFEWLFSASLVFLIIFSIIKYLLDIVL